MSTVQHPLTPVEAASPVPTIPAAKGDWSLSWHGVKTVAALELRQRVRSTRWKIALVVWFVVVGGITLLTSGALAFWTDDAADEVLYGPIVFGAVVFFVLFLGLLVAPTLSASSINGDRNAGTLATLQVTLLTAAEIVVGKLVAAWSAALAFLVVSVPFIAWSLVAGGVPFLSLVTTVLLLAVLLAVVCAIGLGFSALTTKTSGSAVLTYLTVAGLAIVSPILFGLTTSLVTQTEEIRVWTVSADNDWESVGPIECEWQTMESARVHTERTWWLLAVNPFVIVADAAPQPTYADSDEAYYSMSDPLSMIRTGVRYARTGPPPEEDWCGGGPGYVSPVDAPEPDDSVVWPWGLGANLLLGAGGVVVAVRRLRIPTAKLPRGTRVA
ncbi:ABC transporter permease [Oerskovia turbata]|uniref:ABC transporter permease n=1 Tax=Oerskovia turbata TaxID=1713 RepID=A0A4Q1L134_9CELL|nr:ABC transporter permease [Oerskovia turbata]RXR27065.1 ABC transporter permease [Oerskovia turbata]RXR36367.1 ABC transporter permease [Oerskovia turbata]TGJ94681.1 ABC transporter permease [Actinotalea fermentans ATCC 43279 = JCM 9966 = DSM 3133]